MIVPVFDDAETLPETLASVRAQTRQADELILVDDGSQDPRTLALLRELESSPGTPPVRVLHQANRGLAAARRVGIAAAESDWVLPLDADDLLLPTCLAQLSSALARDPLASFSHCQVENFGDDAYLDAVPPFNPFLELDENLLVATALFRRSLFTDGGCSYGELPGFEDWALWLSLIANERTGVLVEEPLFRYRRKHGKGLLFSSSLRRAELTARVQALYPALYAPARRAALKARYAPGFELFVWGARDPDALRQALAVQTLDDVLVTTGEAATRAISSPDVLLRHARGRFVCAADTPARAALAQFPTLLADVALAFDLDSTRALVEAHSVRFLRVAAAKDLRPRELPSTLEALFQLFGAPAHALPPASAPPALPLSPPEAQTSAAPSSFSTAWRSARSLADLVIGPERISRVLAPLKATLQERFRRAARDTRALADQLDPPLFSASRRRELELLDRVPVRRTRLTKSSGEP